MANRSFGVFAFRGLLIWATMIVVAAVLGTAAGADGERVVRASATAGKSGRPAKPVEMSCKALCDKGMDAAGLLVKTRGKVLSLATDGSFATIVDVKTNSQVRVMLTGVTKLIGHDQVHYCCRNRGIG